jgi:hypothetical protein
MHTCGRGKWYDFTKKVGFAWAIFFLLRVAEGGVMWGAPQCSMWVFMSSGTSMRSMKNIMGDTSLKQVRDANLTAERMVVLMKIAHFRKVFMCLEQPVSSLLWFYPHMKQLISDSQFWDEPIWRFFTWFGAFEHIMAKPTVLMTDLPYSLMSLARPKPETKEIKGAEKVGDWICGTKELKASQEYTLCWCRHFRDFFIKDVWDGTITECEDSDNECQEERDNKLTQKPIQSFFKPKIPILVEDSDEDLSDVNPNSDFNKHFETIRSALAAAPLGSKRCRIGRICK